MADQQFVSALDASNEVDLTVTGRKSGREISVPVWFVREGETLYLVPIHGSDSDWYKNLVKRSTVSVSLGAADLSAQATAVTEPAKVEQILDMFRAKYGADDVAAYYPKHEAAAEIPLV